MLVSEELEKTPLHTNFASLDLWSSMAALIAGSSVGDSLWLASIGLYPNQRNELALLLAKRSQFSVI